MKQLIVGLVAIAILGAAPNAEAVTVKEIITLAKVGVSPAEMIKAIERDRTVFRLTIQEILDSKKYWVFFLRACSFLFYLVWVLLHK